MEHMLLALVLVSVFAIRFHLRNIPLERDEGEYAYAGQLMLQGIPPYQLAYNMKLPGTYAAYAAILAIFGQTTTGIHLGLLVVSLVTILLIFFLARKLEGAVAGVAAAAAYGLLSVSPAVLGFAGHATHFVVLAAVSGVLLLLQAVERQRRRLFFFSGLLFGIGFVMKQPGLIFVIFGGLYLLAGEWQLKSDKKILGNALAVFSAGAVLPFALVCLSMLLLGVFPAFWFWTVSYASQYASNYGVIAGEYFFMQAFPVIVRASLGIWITACFGLLVVISQRRRRPYALFLIAFLFFSFLSVCPDFAFRPHYFILLLPAASLFAGVAVSAATTVLGRLSKNKSVPYVPAAIFALLLLASFWRQRAFFLASDPVAACRSVYYGNPFPEAVPIADYIRQHTPGNAKIAVLGSEPEIYFYAHRHSATGYIYTYGLMEEQKYASQMQRQMISEIEASRPEVLVFVNLAVSWLPQPHSEQLIYAWSRNYIQAHYDLAGVVNVPMTDGFAWGNAAKSFQPRPYSAVLVFSRKAQ
jgi:4-amino-4-deoxy-L-arabinose transferase-like glycosyltransferase